MTGLDDLYRRVILDHNRNPRHFGALEAPCECRDGINPLCGDRLRICVREAAERLEEIRFEGTGCAICIASASLLTEAARGLSREQALVLAQGVETMLHDDAPAPDNAQPLIALAGVRAFPSRIKCATLAWRTLVALLRGETRAVSTESEGSDVTQTSGSKHVRTL